MALPTSFLERQENRESFPLKNAGCLSEASFCVLEKRERFLVEETQTVLFIIIKNKKLIPWKN
jgi:hypothetical protein